MRGKKRKGVEGTGLTLPAGRKSLSVDVGPQVDLTLTLTPTPTPTLTLTLTLTLTSVRGDAGAIGRLGADG